MRCKREVVKVLSGAGTVSIIPADIDDGSSDNRGITEWLVKKTDQHQIDSDGDGVGDACQPVAV